MGLSPHSVINVGDAKQEWLTLLHLIATHRPAHLQHDYTTILIQVGEVMPVKSFPAMWEAATMIMLGKYKQGEVWMEGAGNLPCPELCRQDKHPVKDGYFGSCEQPVSCFEPNYKVLHNACKRGAHFCCDLCLVETRAHCFVSAYSSQQEGFFSSSIRLPCSQAFDKERPRSI